MKDSVKYQELTDEELVSRYQESGQERYFEALYNRHLKTVEKKCYSLLKDRSKSSEFSVEIMSKVYEKLPSFKGNSTLSTWLYSITYNYCIDYLRAQKKVHYPKWNKEHELPEIVEEGYEEVSEMTYTQLLDILEAIHPEEKAMILMKYRDDIPIKLMADALRISEGAAKMRLKRAKARVLFLYKSKYKG
jgi:RNA polymerase sigma-70 factor (ECF subfamily)